MIGTNGSTRSFTRIFWKSLEKAGKILISEDLSTHYRELLFDTDAVAS